MHALDYLTDLSVSERNVVAADAGFSGRYVNRMLWTRHEVDYAPLPLAVAAAKHSGGKVDIFASLKPGYHCDWAYLAKYIRKNKQ